MIPVWQRIHVVPEAVMTEGVDFAVAGEVLERFMLPDCVIARDVIHDTWGEHKEAAVHPTAVALGFLPELGDLPLVREFERSEPARWLNRRNRRQFPVLAVKINNAV